MQLLDPEQNPSGGPSGTDGAAAPSTAPQSALPSCPIVALSDDPLLLEALSGAAFDGAPVSSAPSADRFIDQLVANAAGIALIDAASLSTPLKSFLSTLREQFPQLLVLLTGPAQLQAQFEMQIADGTIFRFVHKPASSQRLRLFIDAARRRLAAPDPPARKTPRPTTQPAPAAPRALAPEPAAGRRRGGLPVLGLALAVLVLGGIAWALWRHEFAPRDTPEAAATGTSQSNDAVSAVLGLTTAPTDASSTTLTTPVTPEKPAVPDTLARDSAARDAAAREAATRASAALEQAQRTAQGARAEQVALYVQLARKRLAAGALFEPADDSARSYLESAVALAPDDPDVRSTSIALGEAMIAQFRHAIATGDVPQAQRWLKACSDYRIGSATLSDLSAQLQKLQDTRQTDVATAAPPERAHPTPAAPPSVASPAPSVIAVAAATAPDVQAVATPAPAAAPAATAPPPTLAASTGAGAAASANAGAGAGAGAGWVNESQLTRVTFVPPAYPQEALDRNIVGWVDLEFTVTTEGKVADVNVLAAEPGGVFDRAARSALMRSRYRPVIRDGAAVTQRARIRVRFKQ